MERVIGIDFGTSTTYMSVKRYDGGKPDGDKFSYIPVMFNYGESSGFVASIMRENADGSFDFGEKASEPLEGSRIYTEVKMRLESPEEAERAEARRVTKEFFKFLYETYTQQADSLGESDDVIQTLVSYPVKWQTETAEFMLSAAREAGFPNVMGMDEATAAVSAVLCQNSSLFEGNKEGYLLLVDMGAGTTDLVVCKYQSHTDRVCVETVASWPQSADEPTVGGREIDAALEKYVEDYLTAALNPAMAPMARSLATAYGAAKQWKERNVSVNLAENKPVTTCGYISAYATMLSSKFPAFDRSGFEALIADGLRDYARLVRGCLAHAAALNADFAACGLSLVILTGGHSAWYFARDIVNGSMDGCLGEPALALVQRQRKQVINLPNPQTTVSLGLVYSKLTDGLAQANQPEETPRHEEQQDLPPVSPQDAEEPGEDSFASSQPAQQAPPIRKVEEEEPDAALAAAVKQFIAGYDPSFLKKIFSGNVSAIRQSFGIPYDIEVYLAHDEGLLIKTGKVGVALCSNGIYNSINTKLLPYSEGNRKLDFMSWREYVDAKVTKAPIRVTAGANSFCLNFDYRDAQPILGPTMNDVERFFQALQTYLRECCSLSPTAGSDEKAKAVDAPSPEKQPIRWQRSGCLKKKAARSLVSAMLSDHRSLAKPMSSSIRRLAQK